jgi:hypothetical protein
MSIPKWNPFSIELSRKMLILSPNLIGMIRTNESWYLVHWALSVSNTLLDLSRDCTMEMTFRSTCAMLLSDPGRERSDERIQLIFNLTQTPEWFEIKWTNAAKSAARNRWDFGCQSPKDDFEICSQDLKCRIFIASHRMILWQSSMLWSNIIQKKRHPHSIQFNSI